ncbi:hypothetical protein EVAR_28843_1 [Eumeta japonica]|uniref:Uncharacterized protein n=1 Tax=Eumeta variegata TaxID=151549 RepID=A0A4C1YL88_EUMVA|nr:hypothetical protein EVAR_28843_1 [Eumeta japonica]
MRGYSERTSWRGARKPFGLAHDDFSISSQLASYSRQVAPPASAVARPPRRRTHRRRISLKGPTTPRYRRLSDHHVRCGFCIASSQTFEAFSFTYARPLRLTSVL